MTGQDSDTEMLLKRAAINRKDEEPDQGYHRHREQDKYCAAPLTGRSLHYCIRNVAVRLIEIDEGMPGYIIRKLTVLLAVTRTKTSGPPKPAHVPVHDGVLPSGHRQKRLDVAVIVPTSAPSFRAA